MNDGVIKYSQSGVDRAALGEFAQYEALEACRSKLYELKLIGVYPNGVGYGNISMRSDDADEKGKKAFIITGSQTGELKTLKTDDYVRITQYDTQKMLLDSQGPRSASSESLTHAAIYDALPDAKVVIHVHDKDLWEKLLEKKFPKTQKEVEYGTKEMANAVAALYEVISWRSQPIFVTEGHEDGVFAVGDSIEEALGTLLKEL